MVNQESQLIFFTNVQTTRTTVSKIMVLILTAIPYFLPM